MFPLLLYRTSAPFFRGGLEPPSLSCPTPSDAWGRIKDVFPDCTLPKGCLGRI